MTARRWISTLGAAVALAGCATLTDTQTGTITVDGVDYTTQTRTFSQNGETVVTGEVIYANRGYGCNTQVPGSCEAVVRRLRNADSLRQGTSGVDSSSFVIPGMSGI